MATSDTRLAHSLDATLALIGGGVTPAIVVARLAAHDAIVGERAATAASTSCALGLVRVGRDAGATTYVVTALGSAMRDSRSSAAVMIGATGRAGAAADRPAVDHRARAAHSADRDPDECRSAPGCRPSTRRGPAPDAAGDDRSQRDCGCNGWSATSSIWRASGRVDPAAAAPLRRARAGSAAIASIAPLAADAARAIELDLDRRASPSWVFGDYRRLEQALVNLRLERPEVLARRRARSTSRVGSTRRRGSLDRDRPRPGHPRGGPGAPVRTLLRRPQRSIARPRPGRRAWACRPRWPSPRPTAARSRSRAALGAGSTFVLRRPGRRPERGAERMKILVVDDEPDVDRVGAPRLHAPLARDRRDRRRDRRGALDAVEQERPDIVLLDIGLPDIDGYEVVTRIRRSRTCRW